jgi:hypothetical protein
MTDHYSDNGPLDEVTRGLSESEFQPDVQVHVVVQHIANRKNANENAEAHTFRRARPALRIKRRGPLPGLKRSTLLDRMLSPRR